MLGVGAAVVSVVVGVDCVEATVVGSFRRLFSCWCGSLFVGVEQSTSFLGVAAVG